MGRRGERETPPERCRVRERGRPPHATPTHVTAHTTHTAPSHRSARPHTAHRGSADVARSSHQRPRGPRRVPNSYTT
eukprot:16695-Prymnesium_polylepis.1